MRARTPARVLAAASLKPRSQVVATRFSSSTSTSSSSSSPTSSSSTWRPVVAPGTSPAYDAALDYIRSHQASLTPQLDRLRAIPNPTAAQIRQIEELETEAYVNDPAVRHLFRETKGLGHMDRPVIRHLAEREWKHQGGLDLIMGRVYQNKIVPDLIPDLGPTNPLTLSLTEGTVEPGLVLDSTIFEHPPVLKYQPFQHPSTPKSSTDAPEALYTLLMVDPDSPEPDQHGYSERLHYMKTNIPLSILTGDVNVIRAKGDTIVSYEPPAPPNGTGRHRYIYFLLRQLKPLESTLPPPRERFRTRGWLAQNYFTASSVVGVNFVRSEWTQASSNYIDGIWRQYRGAEVGAPEYKRGPKEERYSMPLSALQQRAAAIRERAWERSLAQYAEVGLASGVEDGADGLEYEAGKKRGEEKEKEEEEEVLS